MQIIHSPPTQPPLYSHNNILFIESPNSAAKNATRIPTVSRGDSIHAASAAKTSEHSSTVVATILTTIRGRREATLISDLICCGNEKEVSEKAEAHIPDKQSHPITCT